MMYKTILYFQKHIRKASYIHVLRKSILK